MEESVDVKSLQAKFSSKAKVTESSRESSRESSFAKSPLPGFGRSRPLATTNGNKLSFGVLPAPLPGPSSSSSLHKYPRPGRSPGLSQLPQEISPSPLYTHSPGAQKALVPAAHPLSESGQIRQTGELLQSLMLRHQGIPTTKQGPSNPYPFRGLPSQRSFTEVIPLKKPLPSEGPRPRKPKRPSHVNLESYHRSSRAVLTCLVLGNNDDACSFSSGGSCLSIPGSASPYATPKQPNKPNSLPQQLSSLHTEEQQDTYDEIGSLAQCDPWNDNESQLMEEQSDDSEVYDIIDERQLQVKPIHSTKNKQKEIKQQKEQEKREQKERLRKEYELRRKFQLEGEIEVIHTARVRHDWQGGKHDLCVRLGDSVEILRVKNNPGGKWLARTLTGTYGYISNTCVDVDYEAVKRKALQHRGFDPSLPPPPPDPKPLNDVYYDVESTDQQSKFSNASNMSDEDEVDYDDVNGIPDEFPLPPPVISIDHNTEKELKKRFKYDRPIKVLHTMIVDTNANIKKASGKDLLVSQGEILDIIQFTSDKKALCRNCHGKFGYVPRTLLLQMDRDIYDDIDHIDDVYDNDSGH